MDPWVMAFLGVGAVGYALGRSSRGRDAGREAAAYNRGYAVGATAAYHMGRHDGARARRQAPVALDAWDDVDGAACRFSRN